MKSLEITAYGRDGLAPYACHTNESRGRLFSEPESPTRTHFHSIEVSQIARSLARALQVDEDLAESLALSHDFGHTPFGHVGEDVLNELMSSYGGFDHNAQSLRIVTMLEQQYAEFDGLNLCWETLEGLVKHNGPVVGDIPQTFTDFNEKWDLELSSHASLEAQCAAVADDIAYNAHDLDDGLRAKLFKLDDLDAVPLVSDALKVVHNISEIKPVEVSDIRACGKTIVCFSQAMRLKEKGIKSFLFDKMYRSPDVMKMRDGAEIIIRDLFEVYLNETGDMPNGLQRLSMKNKSNDRPRTIADFIAGMTDSYAISEHERLFDVTPDLG